jgi:hypothetical protein
MNFISTFIATQQRVTRSVASAILASSILVALPACNKKETPPSNENSPAVPTTPSATNQPAASNASQTPAPPQPEPPAPTTQPLIVSAGTTLTVRLTDKLGSSASQTGQTFSATLDKDVIVDGQTAIPAGAAASGAIVSAKPAGHLAGEASLVLRLTSININNVDQRIVTSTRSFGAKIKAKGKVKKFFGGLAKRAEGDEKEVVLASQSACTFTLKQALEIQ